MLGPDEPALNHTVQDLLQWLSVAFKHREHKSRQHCDNHDHRSCTQGKDGLQQEEQRHTDQNADSETDNLTLGQVEKKLGFDLSQIFAWGFTAARMSRSSCISFSSMCRRPAVSMITGSRP